MSRQDAKYPKDLQLKEVVGRSGENVNLLRVSPIALGRNHTKRSGMISWAEKAGCPLERVGSGVERPGIRNRSEGPSDSGRSEAER